MPALASGSRLGPYEVISPLGKGGMGEVYRARDTRLGRDVAVKVLPDAVAHDADRLARFEREARAAAALNHPNLLAVYDVGIDRGAPFLVSELLEGETLRSRLGRGRLPWRQAAEIARDLVLGLVAAHERAIVHRDLKPENVFLLQDGRAKILDFGLSTLAPPLGSDRSLADVETLDRITGPGLVLGTAGYMAPEQVTGGAADARSDIFAVGVVIYEMLTGTLPFAGASRHDALRATLEHQAPRLDESLAPEALARLVHHCLEKRPQDRFQTSRDLLFALDGVLNAPRATSASRLTRPSAWQWAAAGAGIALAFLLLLRMATGPAGSTRERQRSVAVLPFRLQSTGAAADIEHLAHALPDEIVTRLSYAPGLAVRPFADSSRYPSGAEEPRRAAEALGADDLVVGHFGVEAGRLRVSIEAIHVAENRVIWRDTWAVEVKDVLGLRDLVGERVDRGLLAALGQDARTMPAAQRPVGAEGYDLFLRAVGTSRDPQANKEAITLLERAVSLDPSFAPAWLELSQRSSVDHILAGGGEASFERATRAAERAVSLAPDLLPAAVNKVMLDANAGELVDAYRAATDLVRRRPGSGKAHFALSYVLRYAGAVRAAARECTVAESLDPSDPQLWSCFWTFVYTGELARAEAFVRTALPLHPQVALSTLGDLRMRKGDRAGALEMVAQAGSEITATDIQRGCLEQPRAAGLAKLVDDRESEYAGWRDSEGHYWYGALLADCGLPEAAFRALGRAVDTGYCSYPAVDTDPAWSAVRSHPGFLALRARGVECRRRFLEATGVEDR